MVHVEGIHGPPALDGRIQLVDQLVGNARGDFPAVAPAPHIFVRDDHAVRLSNRRGNRLPVVRRKRAQVDDFHRSEEHTSELQSQSNIVCRLLLEKKKNKYTTVSFIDITVTYPLFTYASI